MPGRAWVLVKMTLPLLLLLTGLRCPLLLPLTLQQLLRGLWGTVSTE